MRESDGEVLKDLGKVLRAIHFTEKSDVLVTHHYYEPPSRMQDREFKGDVSAAYAFGTQVAEVEVWLGIEVQGAWARWTAPLHWALFGGAAVAFWRSWNPIWPLAIGYSAVEFHRGIDIRLIFNRQPPGFQIFNG